MITNTNVGWRLQEVTVDARAVKRAAEYEADFWISRAILLDFTSNKWGDVLKMC